MNEHSSRGHTILTIYIEVESKTVGDKSESVFITRHGKLNFVDLAGSEMVKKTKSVGKALTEANNINKSLMVLGNCISQLSSGKKSGDTRKVHIPYRDSKLTKLLAGSLSGNGITLMVTIFYWFSLNSILDDFYPRARSYRLLVCHQQPQVFQNPLIHFVMLPEQKGSKLNHLLSW
jgi:hypothetical protein